MCNLLWNQTHNTRTHTQCLLHASPRAHTGARPRAAHTRARAHTQAHTHERARARTHTHTHTHTEPSATRPPAQPLNGESEPIPAPRARAHRPRRLGLGGGAGAAAVVAAGYGAGAERGSRLCTTGAMSTCTPLSAERTPTGWFQDQTLSGQAANSAVQFRFAVGRDGEGARGSVPWLHALRVRLCETRSTGSCSRERSSQRVPPTIGVSLVS